MRIKIIKAGETHPADRLKVCAYARVSTDSPEQEGSLLHHKYVNRGRQEYWVCSTRLKRPEEACPGIWVPAEATEGWQIEGKAVVMESTDEFGVKSYSFMEKAAYERRKGCPYKQNISKGEI